MAKHRDLAQIVFATTLGRASAARILRTVVMAGAMIGTPLVAAAETAPAKEATKPAPPANPPASAGAPAVPTRAEEAKAAKDAVRAVETEIKDHDKAIAATTRSLKVAKTAADTETLTATLAAQKTHKDELKTKLATAKADAKRADDAAKAEARAKNPPRPRTSATRPVGRGFILS